MSEARTTITGNLTHDPELRVTASGLSVVNFSVVENRRKRDANGEWVDADPLFMRCTAWKGLAENVGATCRTGTRVTVDGRLMPQSWTDKDTGMKRTSVELVCEDVAVSLAFATATVHRNPRPGAEYDPAAEAARVLGGSPVPA